MKFALSVFIIHLFIINGNAQNDSEYTLLKTSDGASCLNHQVIKNDSVYILNREARQSLECPNVIGIYKNYLFYLNFNNQVKQYNLNNHVATNVFTVYPDMDGVDGPFWSPDHSKIAFTIINQSMNHGYQSYVRVIVFDFDKNGDLSNKQKFDIAAYFECGGNCWSTIHFIDNQTIRYRDVMDKGRDYDEVNYKYLKLN